MQARYGKSIVLLLTSSKRAFSGYVDCCGFVNRVSSDGSVNWPSISRRNYQ